MINTTENFTKMLKDDILFDNNPMLSKKISFPSPCFSYKRHKNAEEFTMSKRYDILSCAENGSKLKSDILLLGNLKISDHHAKKDF